MKFDINTFKIETFTIGYSYYDNDRSIFIDLFGRHSFHRYFPRLGFVYAVSNVDSSGLRTDAAVKLSDNEHNMLIRMMEDHVNATIDEITDGYLEYR